MYVNNFIELNNHGIIFGVKLHNESSRICISDPVASAPKLHEVTDDRSSEETALKSPRNITEVINLCTGLQLIYERIMDYHILSSYIYTFQKSHHYLVKKMFFPCIGITQGK